MVLATDDRSRAHLKHEANKRATMAEERPQAQRVWFSREFTRDEMPAEPFDFSHLSGIEVEFVEVLPPSGADGGSSVVRVRIMPVR